MAERLEYNTSPRPDANPVVQFGRDLLEADKRTGRGKGVDGKDGLRSSERLPSSIVMMVVGYGLEKAATHLGPAVLHLAEKKLLLKKDTLNNVVPAWAKEVVTDAGVALTYGALQKNADQLPKVKAVDMLSLVVDAGAYKGDEVLTRLNNTLRASRIDRLKKKSTSAAKKYSKEHKVAKSHVLTNLTDWLNPVTAGATREAGSAVLDLILAYRDVVTGVPEKPEEKKEPTLVKETTVYIVPDLMSASAVVNAPVGNTVATS